jgi:glutathione S-transferase
MLVLYFAPGSSSMAVHIALHEIGVPFEARPISLAGKEQRAPAFVALNPKGKVPTLVIDERPLTEVAAILFYLAKRFPDATRPTVQRTIEIEAAIGYELPA